MEAEEEDDDVDVGRRRRRRKRKRKMMRLRRMMLRRKTHPKTEVHVVRAFAFEMHMDNSQEQFSLEIYRKNGRGHLRGKHFARACTVKMHMDI